ncbi:MAG: hypothetical protein ACREH4_11145, partial [Vitreimonas sp.]
RWEQARDWWWQRDCDNAFADISHNQLWRNHLLAFAILRQPDSPYKEGYCAVTYHPEDRSLPPTLETYREWLNDGGQATLLDWRLDRLIECIKGLAQSPEDVKWADLIERRYLALNESEEAWRQHAAPSCLDEST